MLHGCPIYQIVLQSVFQTHRLLEAREVIRRELDNALPLLNHREDIIASLLDSWVQVFIKGMTVEGVRMAEFLLDIAIQSVEQ